MTEKQKAEVIRMRQSGTAYKDISNVLGISINTVKSFCNRNNIKKAEPLSHSAENCLNCGKLLFQGIKVKKRKFCCDKCRTLWWNSHPEAVNRKANYKFRCAACGKEFISYGNKHRKYCSHSCYIAARYKELI